MEQGAQLLEKVASAVPDYASCGYHAAFFFPLQMKAEEYFYSGQYKRAKTLFETELNFVRFDPTAEGYMQSDEAYANFYLDKIAHIEQAQSVLPNGSVSGALGTPGFANTCAIPHAPVRRRRL